MLRKLLGSNMPARALDQGKADIQSFAPVSQDPVGVGIAPDILFDEYTLTSLRHKSFNVATHAPGGLYISSSGGVITRTGNAVYDLSQYGINIDNGGVLITSAAESIGVLLPAGTVTNSGEIASFGNGGTGVQSFDSATILNKAEGYIYGAGDGVELYSNSSVANYGKIYGGIAGIDITPKLQIDVTYLENGSTGIVVGGRVGIEAVTTATLINEGEIDGGTYAVDFGSDGGNRLEIDGQAVFGGLVKGGSGTNTLELMEGAAGQLSNFSREFLGFNTITVDSGSYWTANPGNDIANGPTLAAYGVTLTDAGTLVNDDVIDASVVVTHTGSLINNGRIITGDTPNPSALLIDGGIFDNTGFVQGGSDQAGYGVKLATGSTLINAGTIDGAKAAVYFSGTAIRLVVVPGAIFGGGVVGGPGGDTLELARGTIAGTIPDFASENQGFSLIQIDDGASWMLDGMRSLGRGSAIDLGGGGTPGLQATLTSAGTIKATNGILLGDDALFTNLAGGQVAASIYGVSGTSGSIVNAGTIKGSHAGIDLSGQISLTNLAGGYIGGVVGNGTLTNIGTIANVQFSGSAPDRIIIVPGAVFRGHVVGGSGTNTLQLAGVGPGTLSNFGQVFQNFGTVVVDVATNWTLDRSDNLGPGTTLSDEGTLTNAGRIGSGVVVGDFGGSLFNQGQISGPVGVSLTLGGYVDNEAGASISGTNVGIATYGPTTVVNAGVIKGSSGIPKRSADAITFNGTYADRLVVDPGASFVGKVVGNGATTLELAGAGGAAGTATTLAGIGIQFTGLGAITIDSLADWRLAAGQTVAGSYDLTDAGTLANAGTIDSTVTVTGAGEFDNAGTVAGMVTGVVVSDAGTVTNGQNASISGGSFGIDMLAGGSLTNQAGASIGGEIAGVLAAGDSVTNFGTISGGQVGVSLTSVGSVVNAAGGVITGTGISGIAVALGGGGTVTNAGTISGTKAAIELKGTNANRVVADAGAVFVGQVFGGNALSTLELTSGAAATGTITNLADQFSGFGTLSVDQGANWALDGEGFSGSVIDDGSLAAAAGTVDLGAVSGTGTLSAVAGAVLDLTGGGTFDGTLSGAGTVQIGSALTLGPDTSLSASLVLETASVQTTADLTNAAGDSFVLSAASGATISLGVHSTGGNLTNAGTLTGIGAGTESVGLAVTTGGLVTVSAGTLSFLGAVTNTGMMDAAGGVLSLAATVSGIGALQVGAAGTLSLLGGAGPGQAVDFLAGTGLLDLGHSGMLAGTISGFAGADMIDLLQTKANTLSYGNGVLTVSNGANHVASLHLAGTFTTTSFGLGSDGHGGVLITLH